MKWRRTRRKDIELAVGATCRAYRLLPKVLGNIQQQSVALPTEQRNSQSAQKQRNPGQSGATTSSRHLETANEENQTKKPGEQPRVAFDQLPLVPAPKSMRAYSIERCHQYSSLSVRNQLRRHDPSMQHGFAGCHGKICTSSATAYRQHPPSYNGCNVLGFDFQGTRGPHARPIRQTHFTGGTSVHGKHPYLPAIRNP